MKWFVLMGVTLIAATAVAGFESKALPYLNPKIQPRPEVYEGPIPNFEDFTYRNHKCWYVPVGLVCSACYNHPKHYYGQSEILCPLDKKLCRYVISAKEMEDFKINPNQCVRK